MHLSTKVQESESVGLLESSWGTYLSTSLTQLFLTRSMNILLFFVPVAIVAVYLDAPEGWIFLFAFLGLCPLAERISFVTEDLAKYTNDTLGGLLNATFGNITEVIICYYALSAGYLRVVQLSMLGSVFSNCLLVLGCAFGVGGYVHPEQRFNTQAATANASLLLLSVMSLLMPAVLHATGDSSPDDILAISRVTAIMMMCVYGALIYFQLKSHRHIFEGGEDEDDDDPPVLGFKGALFWMAIITIFIAILSEFLVKAIEGAATKWHIPVLFIATILLPIVGNAAEHAAAIIFAYRNKMEIALGIAVGSATQISIFVIPLCVIIGWLMGQPMNLDFHPFETAMTFIVVVLVAFVIHDGTANYLKGLMLLTGYCMLGAGIWVHKDPKDLT